MVALTYYPEPATLQPIRALHPIRAKPHYPLYGSTNSPSAVYVCIRDVMQFGTSWLNAGDERTLRVCQMQCVEAQRVCLPASV